LEQAHPPYPLDGDEFAEIHFAESDKEDKEHEEGKDGAEDGQEESGCRR